MTGRAQTEKDRFVRLVKVVLPLSTLACFCPSPPQPPASDTCDSPPAAIVETVQIAAPRLSADGFALGRAKDDAPPRLLADDDLLWVLRGQQGADMVGLRFVLSGQNLPECIAQDTKTTVGDSLVGHNKDNLRTYEQPDGTRATHTFWIPGAYQSTATVAVTAANVQTSVRVRTQTQDACDQISACPCARALDCTCLTGLSDAGLALYDGLSQCVRAACDGGGLSPSPGTCERVARSDAGACGAAQQACAADEY